MTLLKLMNHVCYICMYRVKSVCSKKKAFVEKFLSLYVNTKISLFYISAW